MAKTKKPKQETMLDIYPTFDSFMRQMLADCIEGFLMGGSAGLRNKLCVWLSVYTRWSIDKDRAEWQKETNRIDDEIAAKDAKLSKAASRRD